MCFGGGSENPHIFVEQQGNARGVMVYVGITSWGPIGPFFFDEMITNASKKNKNSVSGESYREPLVTKVIPELETTFPNNTILWGSYMACAHITSIINKLHAHMMPIYYTNRCQWKNGTYGSRMACQILKKNKNKIIHDMLQNFKID